MSLLAHVFEEEGALHRLEGFASRNGPAFYGFPASPQRFEMEKAPSQPPVLETPAGPITPLPLGMGAELTWRLVR